MNEVEKLKNTKLFPSSFFKEEYRNDFKVTSRIKDLWAILLDLYLEFARVCDKHNLNYFVAYGSLLGAVRHKGFIPWDIDMDVWMPRKDYNKLKQFKNDFKYPFELHWPETENENGYSFLKLRNSRTTAISPKFKNLNINFGIFLDIYPLDLINPETYKEEQIKINSLILCNYNNMIDLSKNKIEGTNTISFDFKNCFNEIEKIASKYQDNNFKEIGVRTICISKEFYPPYKKSFFDSYIEMPFENITVRVPVGWKELLEMIYGNWQEFPSDEKKNYWVGSVDFNPYQPYNLM